MDATNFIYWLQGFLELDEVGRKARGDDISLPNALTATQVQVIKDHIKLVLTKVTPDIKIDPLGFDRIPKRSLRIADNSDKECKVQNMEFSANELDKIIKGSKSNLIC